MTDKTDRDDIARLLLALQEKTPNRLAAVKPSLEEVVQDYVSEDLSHVTKRMEIKTGRSFPLVLEEGAPILKGGGGIVIQATNAEIASLKYAIKAQRPSLLRSQNSVVDSERAYAEYTYHAPLASENIARLFAIRRISVLSSAASSAPKNSDVPLLVLEWVEGARELSKYLSHSVGSARDFLSVMRQCFVALEHLHANGLIHWDVKSDNFLVNCQGTVKLMDIGNARRGGGDKSEDLIALTTEGNFPPVLAAFATPRTAGRSSNRIQLSLDSPKWDDPWLDMWMLARELADLVGLGETAEKMLFPGAPAKWFAADLPAAAQAFPADTSENGFALRYVRLILQRLLYPRSVDDGRYYRSAGEVIHDLDKLTPEFGAGQQVPELRTMPQNVVRIPVSGNAPLTDRVKVLISSELLNRLRRHWQLGTISEVYPGAAHKRFEHSLGVYFAVCQYIKALFADRSNVFWRSAIEVEDIEAVLLAALLHDVGHLAYGHFLEEMVGLFRTATHECYAQSVLRTQTPGCDQGSGDPWLKSAAADHALLRKTIANRWASGGDVEAFLSSVADLLVPPPEHESVNANPLFRAAAELERDGSIELKREILHSILDGAVDADKFDYLRRDGLHSGISYPSGIDEDRFLQSMTALHKVARGSSLARVDSVSSRLHASIAVTDKGLLPVESILFARYQMFQAVYWHHTARAHTAMLQFCVTEYLLSADDGVDDAFQTLVDTFRRSTDDNAIAWLTGRIRALATPTQELLLDASEALRGRRENAYKECLVLRYRSYDERRSPGDVEEIYSRLMQTWLELNANSAAEYLRALRRLRNDFTKRLAAKLNMRGQINDGEILLDIPPAGRDQVSNIFVIDRQGPHYIHELSPMAGAVSETFRLWTRHFRVFCSPTLLRRSGRSRAAIGEACWEVLVDMYLPPRLELPRNDA